MLKLLNGAFNMDKENSLIKKCPLLRKINSSTRIRPETPDLLKNLMKPPNNFDTSSSSSVSNISDAFEEIHKGGRFCTYPKTNKKLSKIDYDKITFQQFTNKFRATMNSLRNDMKIKDDFLNENIDDIVQILQRKYEDQPLPDDIREETERILRDEEYLNSSPSLSFENINYAVTQKENTERYDVLSGVWKMLATNYEEGKFAITYPNYDAFRQNSPHWLETEPLPWQVMDESRAKCERWLNEQCE